MFEDMGIHAPVAFPSLDGAHGRWLPNTKTVGPEINHRIRPNSGHRGTRSRDERADERILNSEPLDSRESGGRLTTTIKGVNKGGT